MSEIEEMCFGIGCSATQGKEKWAEIIEILIMQGGVVVKLAILYTLKLNSPILLLLV